MNKTTQLTGIALLATACMVVLQACAVEKPNLEPGGVIARGEVARGFGGDAMRRFPVREGSNLIVCYTYREGISCVRIER